MSFVFLAPLALAALAALAVPVIVHLTHRQRKEPVIFPSLLFLEQIPYRTERRQRIRHWLLFALRAAVILLIVAAFARPLLEGGPVAPAAGVLARDVVVLLDRSGSMAHGDRWARAVAAARGTIQDVGPEDRLTLVTFADRADALNHPTGDQPTLLSLLANVTPGAGGTLYGPALRLARDLLEDADRGREVVLITDFQRGAADAGDREAFHLPPGTQLTVHDVGNEAANRAVGGVLLDRRREGAAERVTVIARVVSYGAEAADVPVTLELDGQVMQTIPVRVPAGGEAVVRFAPVQDPTRLLRGRVTVPRDALPTDDVWHFLLAPGPRIPVLLVTGGDGREALYLREALAVGHDPAFPVTVRSRAALRAADLDGVRVVVLHGVPFPGGAVADRLLALVRAGGGLLVALGPGAVTLPPPIADSTGPPGREPVSRLDDLGGTAGITEYQHPLFAPFRSADAGDLATARIFRYRPVAPTGGEVLVRFDDGAAALIETRLDAGRVLVWASDFANRWNDLPLRSVFVPFLHSAVRHLAHYVPEPPAWTTGRAVAVDELAPGVDGPLVLERPDGRREAVDVGADAHLTLAMPGFHVLRPRDDRTTPVRVLAVNGDPAESDLTRRDPDELVAAARPREDGAAPAATAAGLTLAERERRQSLWWYLLGAVLLLLAAETLVAHRARRAA